MSKENQSFQLGVFKEKDKDNQYFWNGCDWEKCNEKKIEKLWSTWISSESSIEQYQDEDGYTVFDFEPIL